MAEGRMALLEVPRKTTSDCHTGFLREGVQVLAQAVIEAQVSELTGPEWFGRLTADHGKGRLQRVEMGAIGRQHRTRVLRRRGGVS